jgi:hypothetical protein
MINPDTLDSTEESKLKTGMAMTVQKLLKQRHAREALFKKEFIGLRSDLALRRELRQPLEKVRNFIALPDRFVATKVHFSPGFKNFEKKTT